MAGDWLQIDVGLSNKPEVLMIADKTALDPQLVSGRLIDFWGWVDQHASAAFVPGVTTSMLCRIAGGDAGFWNAVSDVGWLTIRGDGIEIPGYEKRFSKSARQRVMTAKRVAQHRSKRPGNDVVTQERYENDSPALSTEEDRREQESLVSRSDPTRTNDTPETFASEETDHKKQTPDRRKRTTDQRADRGRSKLALSATDLSGQVEMLVAQLFQMLGYSGQDGRVIWVAACLARCPRVLPCFRLSEAVVVSAANGAKLLAKSNAVGFFRTALVEAADKAGVSFEDAMASLSLPKECSGPPVPQQRGVALWTAQRPESA